MENEVAKAAGKALSETFSGPAGSIGELISDRIRFARWRQSLNILKKAKEVADSEGRELTQPELKFLVPFMEACSVEGDPELTDIWARLLVDESCQKSPINLSILTVLKSISVNEAHCLEEISHHSNNKPLAHLKIVKGTANWHGKLIDEFFTAHKDNLEDGLQSGAAENEIFSKLNGFGYDFKFSLNEFRVEVFSEGATRWLTEITSLVSLGVAEISALETEAFFGPPPILRVVQPTLLGWELVKKCIRT